MTQQDQQYGSPNIGGKFAVIVIVLVAIVVAFLTRSWWTTQADHYNEGQDAAKRAEADVDRRVREIGDRFKDRLADNLDASSFLQPSQRLVDEHPEHLDARNLFAQVLQASGMTDRALEQYEKSLAINEQQGNIASLAGTLAMELAKYDVAAKHYAHAVSVDRQNARFRLFLAKAYRMQNEPDKARDELLTALTKLDSNLHEAHAELSDLYAAQGKLSLAFEQAQKAVEKITPLQISERETFVLYVRKKAKLLRRMNKPDESLMTLRDNLTLPDERSNPEIVGEMATSLVLMNETDEAATLYEATAGQHLGAAAHDLWTKAFDLRLRLKQFDAAAGDLEALRRSDADAGTIQHLENKLADARAEGGQ